MANEIIKQLIMEFQRTENTKLNVIKIVDQIKSFQKRIRKHIEDNYVDFLPNHSTSDVYIEEAETLLRETEYLLKNVGSDIRLALDEANEELTKCLDELSEVSLGLRLSYRIVKIDNLFECIDNAKATKDFVVISDLLGKLKYLIFTQSASEIDRLFQKCDCYSTIKVKYHIQSNILQQNLKQRFDRLVQFSEKSFPTARNVILQVSKDKMQLQATVLALFQARYNPINICDFLLKNCLVPIVTKPVSVEYMTDNAEYSLFNISYSITELGRSLRPSYINVFTHIKLLMDCLSNINVSVSPGQHVFTIIGNHTKDRLLKTVVDECLTYAVPETMDEYNKSTLVTDVLRFEQQLADIFFIDPNIDRALSDFAHKFDNYFKQRFSRKVLESALEIMHKDLQDMTTIADGNTFEEISKNQFLFSQCKISKSTLELVKLMERILYMDSPGSSESEDGNDFLALIPLILNTYLTDVPKIHEKLLESIPQQAVLFYNNCMFLAHWVAKNAETEIPTQAALVKSLKTTGASIFKVQVLHQQKLLMQILKEFDLSDTYSIGLEPMKLLRQCLRQMDLLKNVWLNVLPDSAYSTTFSNLLNEFCQDIIKRILLLEDISATVASELSELLQVILLKAPQLFKENHEILRVPCWMKLQQLKMILSASLQEVTEQWCEGAGILTANYRAEEIRHLIRALFQNTDRRAKALSGIV